MKRTIGIFLLAAFILAGCGGSGSKKRQLEIPELPSLKAGPVITVTTGTDDLTPDIQFPPAVSSIAVTGEAKSPGDTVIVWTTGKTLQAAVYTGSTAKISGVTLTPTNETAAIHKAPKVVLQKNNTIQLTWDNGQIVGQQFDLGRGSRSTQEVYAKEGTHPDFVLGKDGKSYVSFIGGDRRMHLLTQDQKGETKETLLGEDLTAKVANLDQQIYFLPNLGVDDAGNVLTVWQETPEIRGTMAEAPNGYPNYASRMEPSGKVTEKDIRIDKTSLPRIADFPTVHGLSSGWVVTWKDTNANAKTFAESGGLPRDPVELMQRVDSQLKATFYNAKGEATGPSVRLDTSAKVFTSPSELEIQGIQKRTWKAALAGITPDHQGNVLVVWTDFRSGKPEVYARLSNLGGTQLGPEIRVGEGWNGQATWDGKNFQVVWMNEKSILMRTYAVGSE